MLSKCCGEVNLFAGLFQMAEKLLWRHGRRQQISVVGSWRGLGSPAMLSSLPVGKKQHYTDKCGSGPCISSLAYLSVEPPYFWSQVEQFQGLGVGMRIERT